MGCEICMVCKQPLGSNTGCEHCQDVADLEIARKAKELRLEGKRARIRLQVEAKGRFNNVVCQSCSSRQPADAKFCMNCGTKLNREES